MIIKITNARIVTHERIFDQYDLYLEKGVIKAITDKQLPYDSVIDAEGNYLSAGFIDLHVHGALDCDFMDGVESGVIAAANFHCKHGTTTIFPTTLAASYEETANALEAIKNAVLSGQVVSNVGGVHMEGPYFSQNQCGAQNAKYITAPVKADYERILKEYGTLVRRWSFAPELEGTRAFMETLAEYHVVSSIAHSDAQYADVMAVYENGCSLITHFYSCISSITREKGFRILGVTECGYLLRDMMVEAIADGCHVPKELFQMLYQIKGKDFICLVTDAMRCAGSTEKESHIGGVPCKIKNGVACLLDESAFAGSIATTDRLVRFCVHEVGIPLCEAIRMITVNPAKAMGLNKKGYLSTGYDADLVIFNDNIEIQKVFVGGEQVFSATDNNGGMR